MHDNDPLWGISSLLIVSCSSTAPPQRSLQSGPGDTDLMGLTRLGIDIVTFLLLDHWV